MLVSSLLKDSETKEDEMEVDQSTEMEFFRGEGPPAHNPQTLFLSITASKAQFHSQTKVYSFNLSFALVNKERSWWKKNKRYYNNT